MPCSPKTKKRGKWSPIMCKKTFSGGKRRTRRKHGGFDPPLANRVIRKKLKNNTNIYVLPQKSGKSVSSNFCVNIVLNFGGKKLRNNLILKLQKNKIGVSVHYPVCLPKSLYYKNLIGNENFDVAEHFASHTISLPCGPHLDSEGSNLIADTFNECLEKLL